MATRSKTLPSSNNRLKLRRRFTREELERLKSDPHYRAIIELHEKMKKKYGMVEESWPLIREDRER